MGTTAYGGKGSKGRAAKRGVSHGVRLGTDGTTPYKAR